MPQPDEPYYCSEQINIPPELPDILKQFTKAAIRTQPKDVLAWSAAYFRAMASGETPPVKQRMEMATSTQKTDTGLTIGMLKILHKQLGPRKQIDISVIEEKWRDLSLPKEKFDEFARIGGFAGEVVWLKFFALACSDLGENLTDAMKMICEILTADPDGGPARIAFPLFQDLYRYLAQIDGDISEERIQNAVIYLQNHVDKQEGFIQPRNFLSPEAPKLF